MLIMYSEIANSDQNAIIAGKYRLDRCIGKGSFGSVYVAKHISSDKNEVALKLEEVDSGYVQLHHEYRVIAKMI